MNKITKAALITAGVSFAILAGCSSTPPVDTGANSNIKAESAPTQGEATQTPEKRFYANFAKEFGGVKVTIAEIVIKEDMVQVGLTYENTKSQKVDWYPDQGQLVIGDMQLNVDPLTQSGLTTGTIAPGTKSDGVLTFIPPAGKKIDVSKVKELQFHLGEIFPEDLSSTTKVDFTIPVK